MLSSRRGTGTANVTFQPTRGLRKTGPVYSQSWIGQVRGARLLHAGLASSAGLWERGSHCFQLCTKQWTQQAPVEISNPVVVIQNSG